MEFGKITIIIRDGTRSTLNDVFVLKHYYDLIRCYYVHTVKISRGRFRKQINQKQKRYALEPAYGCNVRRFENINRS